MDQPNLLSETPDDQPTNPPPDNAQTAPLALIPSQAPDKIPAWGVGESWLSEYERIAVRIAASTTLPEALQRSPQNILAVALAGRELGLGFMEATRQIDIINGVTALRAELKMALAVRAGMVVDSVQSTDTGCTITAHRADTGTSLTVTFTEADKKKAKLGTSSRSAWDTYPEDMFYARASSRLVRRLMPDARGASFRSVEELTDEVTQE